MRYILFSTRPESRHTLCANELAADTIPFIFNNVVGNVSGACMVGLPPLSQAKRHGTALSLLGRHWLTESRQPGSVGRPIIDQALGDDRCGLAGDGGQCLGHQSLADPESPAAGPKFQKGPVAQSGALG